MTTTGTTHELNTTTMLETSIQIWNAPNGTKTEVTWHENKITKRGSLWVYVNDRVVAFGCSIASAQAKVNEAAEQSIWTA